MIVYDRDHAESENSIEGIVIETPMATKYLTGIHKDAKIAFYPLICQMRET